MAYDPLKALQAAGILGDPMPEPVKVAIAQLSQAEVDLIISAQTTKFSSAALKQWMIPAAMPVQGPPMTTQCLCGIWSGAGTGGSGSGSHAV